MAEARRLLLALVTACLVGSCGPGNERPRSSPRNERPSAVGSASLPTAVQPYPDRDAARAALAAVRLDDGLSRSEAEAIGSYFFFEHLGLGCGVPDRIRETESNWVISTRVGYAGDLGDDIVISKSDGSVMWREMRCVTDPLSMLGPHRQSECLSP
jgi:hypothetical protein